LQQNSLQPCMKIWTHWIGRHVVASGRPIPFCGNASSGTAIRRDAVSGGFIFVFA